MQLKSNAIVDSHIPGIVEASEWAAQPRNARQHVLLGNKDILHEDHAGVGGSEGELALNLWRRQTRRPFLDDEAADAPVLSLKTHTFLLVRLKMCQMATPHLVLAPDNKDVGNGRVGDPILAAVQDVTTCEMSKCMVLIQFCSWI